MNAILAYMAVQPIAPPKDHPSVRKHVMEDTTDEEEVRELGGLSSWSRLDPETRARCAQRAKERRRLRMAEKQGEQRERAA